MGPRSKKSIDPIYHDENNDPSPSIKRKRTKKIYSFTPTTTTNFRSNTSTPVVRSPKSTKPPKAQMSPKLNKKTPRKRTIAEQGSDDHVYWEMTPSTGGAKIAKTAYSRTASRDVPSSPLVETKTDADPLIPFLKKYNTTLENISSQTPDSSSKHPNGRRSSDPEIKERPDPSSSPTLNRTKSTGLPPRKKTLTLTLSMSLLPSATVQLSSSSTKNINKLLELIGNSFRQTGDVAELLPLLSLLSLLHPQLLKDDSFDDDFDNEWSSELENISLLFNKPPVKQETPEKAKNQPEPLFLDDNFSDEIDMNELDNLVDQLKSHNSTPAAFEEDDDDFLDDGLDNLVIEITQNPNSVLLASAPILAPAPTLAPLPLTTQELRKSDMNNYLLFKKEHPSNAVSSRSASSNDSSTNKAKSAIKKLNFHRYQILEILQCKYTKKNRTLSQKILTVLTETGTKEKVIVRDLWETLEFVVNDVIHIVGTNPRIVDSENNLLIWNPDFMLSATAVGDALVCERKAVLNSRLSFPGDCSVPLIVGNVVHTIFQECLVKGDCTVSFISELIEDNLQLNLINILSINETKESVKAEIVKHVPYIQTWFANFVTKYPKVEILSQNGKSSSLVSVSESLDVEEYIWSPMYGIRGLIDVTVELYVKDSEFDGRYVTPLEIKTGGSEQLQHRAQTSLYTLLIKERYDIDSEFFLLVYSKLKEMKKHAINPLDLKHLINIRNRISSFLKEDTRELPPLLQQSKCDRCFALEACMTMNSLMEDGSLEQSKLKEGLYESITAEIHGNQTYRDFFNHWDTLITKEESVINALKKELWTKTSRERESMGGKAVGDLKIVESIEEGRSFLYTLERSSVTSVNDELNSLQNSQLAKHDRVIISDENGHFALSSGWIVSIRPSFLTIRTDRRIINSFVKCADFNVQNNQRFKSVLQSSEEPAELIRSQSNSRTYRIDKDEMFHGLALARYNLLNLFLPHVGDVRRRRNLVDLVPPRFADKPLPYTLPQEVNFNADQRNAFDKVLKTMDYSLILGMPGTGKTTAILQLIRFLVANNKSVLLASYTHSAVDNILTKLVNDDFSILRTGYASKVHPEVKKYVPNSKVEGSITVDSMDAFRKLYIDLQIVATTCLGIGDVVFNHRKNFDFCIIDELSQVSMPVCLGPLRFCDKFILVGDHYQLPPLVVSSDAKQGGLDKSLFKTLSDKFPESVVDLSYQYRMCADIMLLSNTLVYEGRLKCGTAEVANQKLHIPLAEKLDSFLKDSALAEDKQWIKRILNPDKRVLFLNHDELPALERIVGEKVQNDTEAELVRQVVQSLIHCGVDEKSIGVMSLYRAQLRLLHRKLTLCKDVEILTADQFQGRDKDCVIISLVRSNENNNVGDLLKEWRRINVAITRARSKLIILGSKRTMNNLNTLQAFMSIIETRGWMLNLPRGADQFYNVFLDDEPTNSTWSPQRSSLKKRSTLSADSKMLQNRPIAKNIVDEMIG